MLEPLVHTSKDELLFDEADVMPLFVWRVVKTKDKSTYSQWDIAAITQRYPASNKFSLNSLSRQDITVSVETLSEHSDCDVALNEHKSACDVQYVNDSDNAMLKTTDRRSNPSQPTHVSWLSQKRFVPEWLLGTVHLIWEGNAVYWSFVACGNVQSLKQTLLFLRLLPIFHAWPASCLIRRPWHKVLWPVDQSRYVHLARQCCMFAHPCSIWLGVACH